MTYLPSLFKKIDNFCRLVGFAKTAAPIREYIPGPAKQYEGYDPEAEPEPSEEVLPPPEESNLYSFVMGKVHEISNEENDFANEDIANQLAMMADLYKKAIQINGGYAPVQHRMRIAMAEVESAIDESEGRSGEYIKDLAYELLSDMSSDLSDRAKTTPNQMSDAEANKALREVQSQFLSQEARQEMASQKSVYEKGKPGAERERITRAPDPLKTPENYAAQINVLQKQLEMETDPTSRTNIQEQIDTLTQLIKQMALVRSLSEKVSEAPDSAELKAQFDEASRALGLLRAKRTNLRKRLSNIILKSEQDKLLASLATTSDPRERRWIEEKIKLLILRTSSDLRKRDEIKARKALINALGVIDERGDFQAQTPSEMDLMTLERAVLRGADMKVSKAKYDRGRTEELAKEQGRQEVPVAAPIRGGGRVPANIDFSKATYPALIKKFRDLNNTAIDSARKYIMRPHEKGDPALKPYVDAISAAVRKRDKQAQAQAVLKLREEIAKTLVQSSSLKSYIQALRLLPHFKRLEAALYELEDKQDENGKWNLTPAELSSIQTILKDIERLKKLYSRYFSMPGKKFHFRIPVTEFFSTLEEYIKTNMLKEVAAQEGVHETKYRVPAAEEIVYRVPTEEEAEETESPEEELKRLLQEQEAEMKREKKKMTISRLRLLSRLMKEGQSKEDRSFHDRIRTVIKSLEKGQHTSPLSPPQRGGPRARQHYDLELVSFEGIIDLLQDKINTGMNTAKQRLTRPKLGGTDALKPYVDAVSEAIRKDDKAAKYTAISKLREQVSISLGDDEHLRILEKSARLLPHFRALKDELKQISKWQENDEWHLDVQRKEHIAKLIDKSERLAKIGYGQSSPYFTKTADILMDIVKRLQEAQNQG